METAWLSRVFHFMVAFLLASIAGVSVAQQQIDCSTYSLNDVVSSPGDTNGSFLAVQVGDVFTFTMTPGTATAASWRIVSDGSGDPGSTLVAGGTVSGTLIYTVTVAAPGGTGIGYYLDSIDGTATIQASCSAPVAAIPTLSEWGLIILAMLMAGAGLVSMRRRMNRFGRLRP